MASSALPFLALFVVAVVHGAEICDQFGSTTVGGRYVVMNNRWGTDAPHCIEVLNNGFRISRQDGVGGLAPVSYPAIFFGCHYDNCSPGTNLPLQLFNIRSATSSISYSYVAGTYDAAYDIWLDPNPNISSNNAMEIMIWFNRQGSIQPIGGVTGSVSLAGVDWEIWQGSNGSNNVISYVAKNTISSLNFNLLDFLNDGKNRGLYGDNWYLTSVQAGFEPWIGGVGLTVNSFNCQVN